jgi:hypothetical protein
MIRHQTYRPCLEALEDRTLLSTLVIDPKNLVISAAAGGVPQYTLSARILYPLFAA